MIDTIRLKMNPIPIRDGMVRDFEFPGRILLGNWYYQPKAPRVGPDGTIQRWASLVRQNPGRTLRVLLTNREVTGLEVSLSNLYYGSGGLLIESPEVLDSAFVRLWERVSEVCELQGTPEVQFTRVDLSLQFAVPGVPPSAYQRALRNARHPMVRSDPVCWEVAGHNTGLRFNGTYSKLRIYDKRLEMGLSPGPVVRIEVELTKDSLKSRLGDHGALPVALEFSRCYQVYRDILMQFPSPVSHLTIPEDARKPRKLLPHLVAELEHENISLSDGSTAFELFERMGMSRNAQSQLRNEMVSAQLQRERIFLNEMLPEQWPPPHFVSNACPPGITGA